MRAWRVLIGVVVEPVTAFRALAEQPRALLALAAVVLCHLAVPFALSGRIDNRRQVISNLAMQGELKDMTDRELEEKVERQQKIVVAGAAAGSVVGPPFLALGLCLALWLWGRYLGGRPKFGALYSLCVHAQVPLALRSLAQAAVIVGKGKVSPDELGRLLPSGLGALMELPHAPWARAFEAFDFFRLWVVVLLGLALYVAGPFSRTRAAVGMGLAYAAFVAVFLVGLPGMGGA